MQTIVQAVLFSLLPLVVALALAETGAAQRPADAAIARELQRLRQEGAVKGGLPARVRHLLSRAGDTRSPRSVAAETLLAEMPGAAAALRKVAENHRSARFRRTALAALLRRGVPDRRLALHAALRDKSTGVRQHVLDRVLELRIARSAIPELATALRDPEPKLRLRAAEAMAAIGDESALAHLRRAIPATRCDCATTRVRRERAHVAVITSTSVLSRMSAEVA